MVQIAVMGYGTVGSGVVEVMEENTKNIAENALENIEVKYILDVRDFPGCPYASKMIKDFSIIENDPEIQVVVEAMGGVGFAYEFTKRCLLAGKSVVTSNKELVASKGNELIALAKGRNLNYLFEASVGGGIPIIRPITQCLAANQIDEIYGILNGTTNYILTEMIKCGKSFEEALAEAQENGYAEQDPSADVDGIDTGRKISILGDLCFGRHIDPSLIKMEGISGVTMKDVGYARRIGYKIKLLGRALRTGDDTVTAYVAPHLVRLTSLLANVDGVMNGIIVRGNAIGEAMFYGAGAGKRPTASAVVADIIDAVKHLQARKYLFWDDAFSGYITDSELVKSRWFVRCASTFTLIREAFGNVKFIHYKDRPEDEYAFVTEEMDGVTLSNLTDKIDIRSRFRVFD